MRADTANYFTVIYLPLPGFLSPSVGVFWFFGKQYFSGKKIQTFLTKVCLKKLACLGFRPILRPFLFFFFCCNNNYYSFYLLAEYAALRYRLCFVSAMFSVEECVSILTYKRTGTIALITKLRAWILHFSSSCICNVESLASLMSLNIFQINCSFLFQWSEESKRRKFQTGCSAPTGVIAQFICIMMQWRQ